MEESSGANGSAPVRAHTHTIATPILCLPTTTVSSSAFLSKGKIQEFHLPPVLFPPFLLPLLKLIPERAHTYRAHISISARLCLIHLFVFVFTCACLAAIAYECNHVCAMII